MPFLRAHAISFSFADSHPLFSNLSFQLEPGFTSIVGENGVGKTTLLRVLIGELTPTNGHIQSDCITRSLATQQTPSEAPTISELIAEPSFHKALGRLGLDLDQLDRWQTLSFGERKRWQIATHLCARPDLLLLDEPSNHLDAQGRSWLIAALEKYQGIGVLISHDRQLLDALSHHTLQMAGQDTTMWRGNYSEARDAWMREESERRDARLALRREQEHAAAKLADARRAQHGAESARSMRHAKPGDSDARGILRQNIIGWAAAKHGRQVGVNRRALERINEELDAFKLSKEVGRESVWLGHEAAARPVLLSLGGRTVGRTDRIRISGRNGAGKTTMLRQLLAAASLPPERVLYLPQETTPEMGAEVLKSVRALDREEKGQALSLVAALGLDPDHLLVTDAPSPGEVRKLMFGLALAQKAWLLVLDEPTNHLDLPSVERLERALAEWPGALLLVTHDDTFAASCTTETWAVDERQIRQAFNSC